MTAEAHNASSRIRSWTGAAERRTAPRVPYSDAYTSSTRTVSNRCMSKVRTNIEIEDSYLRAIIDRYHLRTKTEAVDFVLRHLAGQPMSREEALAMRGARAIENAPADSSPPNS